MLEELNSLLKNNTWDLKLLLLGKNLVAKKSVFKVKSRSNGSIEKYKARLVAKGYSQTYRLENIQTYDKTYASTAKANSMRMLLAVATREYPEIVEFDIKTTYLHGDLEENIYMALSKGWELFKNNFGSNDRQLTCHLLRSLYNLRQMGRH